MFNGLTSAFVSAALAVINLFPESPISLYVDVFQDSFIYTILGYVNYIIPISLMLNVLALWLTCVATYYIYQICLRWIRVVE